ncbi:type I secretion C-terminal target domain-containing protein, partial [Mesorhizobium sp. B2-3-2]
GAGSVSVTVTATDGDGDHVTQSADISQTVVFEDDGPKAVGTASITANVDEDGLAGHNPDAGRPGETGAIGLSATVTGAAGALIALVDFGADGPGAQAFHLASTAVPVDSGLTSQGAHVLIVSDGNTLHGYAEAGNGAGFSDGDREVFQLTVKADGSYVFTLKDQIDHPALDSQAGDNGENQLTSPIDLSSYIVATDGDGDSISLGAGTFLIQVLDDIPVQTSATVAGNVGEDALLLANSNGHSVGNPDGDGLGTVATGSLSSLVSAGADEPGSFSLIQNPTGLPAATSKGEAIVYHVDGTVLTGYVESGTPGLDAGDRKVFTLDVQPNGTYTFTLLDQIDHLPNSPANDDNQKLVLDFTHALQFTDADGDTIAITGETTTTTATTGLSLHPGHYDTYTVGGVTFDGLTFNGTLAHDFNNGAGGDSFNVSGQGVGIADNHIHDNEGFIFSRPGTDAVSFTINGNGSGTISWEAYNGAGVPISGGAGFQTGTMVMPANGSVVTIDPTGTFDHLVIRFDLDSGDKIRADDFLYTSTTTTSGGVFTIGIEDDIPVALNGSATLPTVYEDTLTTGLSTGNPDGGSQPSSITFWASAFASLVSIGADDNATFSFNVATNKTSAGVSSGGSAVHFEVGVDAVSGVSDDGRTVFTIKDNDDGTFTFTLLDQVDHAPGSGEDGTLAIDIGSLFKATDFDGDSVNLTGTLNVVVQNDTPLATTATASIMVREDNLNMAVGDGDLSTGITNGPMDTMSTHSDEATFTSAQLQLLVKPGADGPAVFVLNASPTGNVFTVNGEVVTSHGENVRLGAGPAGSVVGYVDGGTHDSVYTAGVDRVVFTLTDNGGGSFKFDLKDHLDHNIFGASGAGDDKTLTLDLTDAFSARDFDGDVAPLGNHAIQVVVENDVPVVGTSAVQLDEDGFAGGNLGGPADFDPATSGPIAVVANLNVNFGADGAGITAFLPASITLPAAGEFTLGTVSATSVFIQQHGVDVLEIDLINAATGSYTVTQLHVVDHPAAGTEDNLQFTIGYQATDFDGDTATGSFTINVNDDTPTIVAPGATVAESTAASFSNTFTPASATGSLGISWGADNANPDTGTHDRSVAFSPLLTGVQAGLTSDGDAITYTLSSENTVLTATATHNSVIRTVFTVSINDQTNGNYSFDLRDNIDHTAPAFGADKALSFGFTATDSDGDSTSSFLTVHVTDDIPVVTSAAETGSVSESPLPSVQSAFGNLNIDWNADDRGASHLEFGRDAGNNLIVPLGLTSGGVDLDYSQRMAANGVDQELVAYKHGETDANPVFIVTLNGIFNPAFAFSLFQPLDHTGGSDASLPLGFTVKAIDGDGDSVTQSFTVNVADAVPVAANDGVLAIHAENVTGLTIGTVSGILGNDHYGADGPAASGSLVIGTGDHGGTVTVDGLGNLVYTNTTLSVANGTTVDETFTYTIKDGDGDTTTTTFKVTLTDTGVTALSTSANLIADEDDLATGNHDAAAGDATPVLSGHIAYTLGADALGSVALSTAGNATGLKTLSGADVDTTWSGGQLIGYVHGTDPNVAANQVFTIAVTNANNTGADYTMTLLQPVQHTVSGTEDDTTPFTVTATVTDTDGSTGTTSFTVVIDDDLPVASNYTGAAFAEGSGAHDMGDAVTLLGIGAGADGLQGTLQGLAFTNQGTTGGMLSIDGAGHLIYTAPANVTSASTVTETFSYTVSDKDGDTVTRQVTFGVSDTGITNVAASQNLVVDEDDIVAAGGNAGGPGDDAPVTGGHISYTLGADALSSVALSVASTGLIKLDGTAVSTSWDAASHTLTGYGSSIADVVFTITLSNITATGADYTVALNQPVSHPVHDDAATAAVETAFEDNLGFTVTATVTDADNSTGTTSFTVAIDDDVPVAHNDTDSFGTGVIGSSTSGNVIDGTGTNEGLHGTGTDTLGADGVRISGVTGAGGTDTDVAGGGFVVSGQFGTLALQEDGSYVYTRVSGLAGSDVFTYTLKDGDGDTTTATLTVGLDSTGQPTATSSSILVDEDDLAAGVHNTNSTGDDTTSNPENISLGSYGPDGHGALSFNVTNGDAVMDGAFAVKHDGVALHYYYDPTAHTLYGTTDTSSAANAASHAAFKIEVNETAATYNFTLLQEVDHPQGGGENDINLSLGYTITDSNGDHANGAIGIKIDDDMPVAKADTVQVDEGSKPTLNAILVLDLSLSMNSDPDGAGGFTTRLALMQAAVQNFLSSSTVIFNQITIYSFGVGAELVGQYTIGEGNYIQSAINTVNGFNSNSLSAGTQYDSAANLIDGRSNNADRYANLPHPTADATNIYFLSDGDPQSGASLDANEQTSWSNFLATSHVNQVFALGFSDIANTNFLAQIASRPGDIAEAVTDPTELSSTLAGALPSSASGSILADHGLGADAFGADGGHIQSIAIDGTTYTFNGTNAISLSGALPGAHLLANDGKSIEVTTSAGGKLTFYFADGGIHHAGDYDYTAPVNVNADKIETFHYVLVDGDGDTAGADLQITVLDIPNAAPVITAPNGGSDFTVSVPENTTAVTDINATDANGDTLTYSLLNTAGTDFAKFSINASTGLLTFLSAPNFEAPTDNGANNSYVVDVQVSDGHGGNDTHQITVNVTDVGEVTAGNDIVRTNFDGATFTVPEWALLFNDSGATDISGVSNASSLTVGNPSNTISIDDGNNADGGTFDYTATNGVSSDTASVQVSNINGGGNVTGTLANEILVGNDSANTFNGAGGVDIILAGGGNDTIIADQNDYVIDGGSGTDTLQVNGNFTSVSDAQIANVENVTLTAAAVLNLSSQTEGFVITGSSGADSITGGAGNDTIIGAQNDTLLAGGSGTDTLQIGASFNDNNDGQITGIENITLTAASTLDLSSQTEAFKIIGSSSADTITGGSANDIINGGGGNDTLSGGAGNDQFRFATNTGTDTVNSFVAGADKIGFLEGTGTGAVNFGTAGTAAGATFAAGDLVSHTTIAGIANSDDNKVILITTAQASNVIDNATGSATNSYVVVYDSNDNRAEIWFDTDWSTASSRTQVATINGLTQAQVAALTVSDFVAYNSATDPIILDLNHDGFAFSDVSHGVQFDINADGHKDQVAWNTSNDGMLAVDLNHDGKIDDGTELFTPSFGGGKFASGAAALASLDGNHDGVIDHNDAAFDSLLIWKDANVNGASDAGELSHLADNGIVSISTAASPAVGEIDGQTVTGNGTFQMADGTTGNYVEVELDTSLGAPAQPTVASDGTKTFAIGSLEVTDLIADFHDGAKGDQIDLTALLKGLAGVTDLEAGGFVEIAQSSANAANAEVKVDTNGGGDNYHTVAVLENYTFHSAAEAVKILYDDSHGTKQDVA